MVQKVEVWQTDVDQLYATVEYWPSEPHYVVLPHNTATTVWTPVAGRSIHLVSLIASVESAGVLRVRRGATTFIYLEFGERKAVHIDTATDVRLDVDETLTAIFVGDAGTPNGYITAFGHEH